jgi:hypothetical protein
MIVPVPRWGREKHLKKLLMLCLMVAAVVGTSVGTALNGGRATGEFVSGGGTHYKINAIVRPKGVTGEVVLNNPYTFGTVRGRVEDVAFVGNKAYIVGRLTQAPEAIVNAFFFIRVTDEGEPGVGRDLHGYLWWDDEETLDPHLEADRAFMDFLQATYGPPPYGPSTREDGYFEIAAGNIQVRGN